MPSQHKVSVRSLQPQPLENKVTGFRRPFPHPSRVSIIPLPPCSSYPKIHPGSCHSHQALLHPDWLLLYLERFCHFHSHSQYSPLTLGGHGHLTLGVSSNSQSASIHALCRQLGPIGSSEISLHRKWNSSLGPTVTQASPSPHQNNCALKGCPGAGPVFTLLYKQKAF